MADDFFSAAGVPAGKAHPGAALVVVDGGGASVRVSGQADLEQGAAVSPDSLFHVASVAKQFTGLMIARFIARGRLQLSTRVGDVLSWAPDVVARCEIKHLLFHTSGLRDQWALAYFAGWRAGDPILTRDVRRWIEVMDDVNYAPGERFLYCNTGYTLLAMALEALSGQSFASLLRSEIFEPAGMSGTVVVEDPASVLAGRVHGYAPSQGRWLLSEAPYGVIGSTSLRTSASDMAAWLSLDLEGAHFEEARQGGFFNPGHLDSGAPIRYGYGVIHGEMGGQQVLMHGGYDYGFNAAMLRSTSSPHAVFACGSGSYARLEQAGIERFRALVGEKQARPSEAHGEHVRPKLRRGVYADAKRTEVRAVVKTPEGGLRLEWMQGFDLAPATSRPDAFQLVGTPITVEQNDEGGLTFRNGADTLELGFVEPTAPRSLGIEGDYFCDELGSVLRICATRSGHTIQIGRSLPVPLTVVSDDLIRWESYWGVLRGSGAALRLRVSHPRCLNIIFKRKRPTDIGPARRASS